MSIRCLVAAIAVSLTAAKAASAVVEYTYTTNGYDLSVWEDWELAWIEDEYFFGKVWIEAAKPRKMVSFEVECEPGTKCTFAAKPGTTYRNPIPQTITNTDAYSSVSEIIITYEAFTDDLYLRGLSADFSSGDILSWSMWGGEYGGIGDYILRDVGDTFSFILMNGLHISQMEFYCMYTYGAALDYKYYGECDGGQPAKFMKNRSIDLGQGTWTSRQVSPVPLPASIPLLIAALVGLRWLPRRRTA